MRNKNNVLYIYGNTVPEHINRYLQWFACTEFQSLKWRHKVVINNKVLILSGSNADCGIPVVIQGTTMMGSDQGIGIGHHRLYKCGTLEEKSVCKDDGHWTYVKIICSLEGKIFIYQIVDTLFIVFESLITCKTQFTHIC